jgi:hypothetical protein
MLYGDNPASIPFQLKYNLKFCDDGYLSYQELTNALVKEQYQTNWRFKMAHSCAET